MQKITQFSGCSSDSPARLIACPAVPPQHFAAITETKTTLSGARKVFACQLLSRTHDTAVLLFVSEKPMTVGGLTLPVGTVTFGYFWASRPYNVYHWMSPTGATLGHYFNLADRTQIRPDALHWRDLTVDILALPGASPLVLDEDELPADLDPATRQSIARTQAEILAHAAGIATELESASHTLWPQVFAGARS